MSGFKGENLDVKSDKNMGWYEGFKIVKKNETIHGYTLLDALDLVISKPKRLIDLPLRMPVSGIHLITGIGDVITGRIEQGTLKRGENVRFLPSNTNNTSGKVFSIEMHHKNVNIAYCGDNVGISVRGTHFKKPKIGDIMCLESESNDYPSNVNTFSALVFVQDHPGQLKASILNNKSKEYKGGFTPIIHIRTCKVPCQMIKIEWKLSKYTNNQKLENPKFIQSGDQAQVIFKPLKPIICEAFDTCKPLGRLAAMDSNNLVIIGKIITINPTF